jgi:hypothetical protein
MPEWFQVGITQSMQWTLLAPYIKSCPESNTKLVWQNFPALHITNNPNASDPAYPPAITHNRTQLSYPGREVTFEYEDPGKCVGPDGKYVTSTNALGPAKYAAWISQLNTTYVPLYDIGFNGTNTAKAVQPNQYLFSELNPLLNGTVYVALVDEDVFVTPHNITFLNDHIVAGPALYQVG